MKEKGFTLIELLAVIIILGVISVIAVPTVNNYIKDSKTKTFKVSIQNMIRAMKHEQAMQEYIPLSYNFPLSSDAKLELEGDTSDWEGIASIEEDGKTTVAIYKEGYCGYKRATEEVVTVVKMDSKEECLAKLESGEPLISELVNQSGTSATTTEGFKNMGDGTYIYQGASGTVGTNWLWYAGHQWRIMKIDSNTGKLTLITAYPVTAINWGDSVTNKPSLEQSHIGDWLNNVFIKSFPTSIQNKLESMTYTRKIYNGSTVVNTSISNVKVRLLTESEYAAYSGADHYLDIKDYQRLGDVASSTNIYYVSNDGTVGTGSTTGTSGFRPVIEVANLTFQEGKGTINSPYIGVNKKATVTNAISVGEYIRVPKKGGGSYLTRVVKQEPYGTKVILNGLYSTSAFGNDVTFSNTNTIYTGALTEFKNTLDSAYFSASDKPFEYTMYSEGSNYKSASPTYANNINVGLPSVGELFSGNDIDMGATKIFADETKIENTTLSDYYWVMNAYSATYMHKIGNSSDLNLDLPTNLSGVRPTWYLTNVSITGGKGTANNPYTLK